MKHIKYKQRTQLQNRPTEKGESIEEMLRRLTTNKEKIPENVPPIYTPMSEGILPDYDIRADRFDVAIEAQDKFTASKIAQSAGEPITEEIAEEKTSTNENVE